MEKKLTGLTWDDGFEPENLSSLLHALQDLEKILAQLKNGGYLHFLQRCRSPSSSPNRAERTGVLWITSPGGRRTGWEGFAGPRPALAREVRKLPSVQTDPH